MLKNVIVLGGMGKVGRLLAYSLRDSGIAVTLVDRRVEIPTEANGMALLEADIAEFGREVSAAVAAADAVFVCLPEKITLQLASRLAAAMPDGSLWLDTLSVKGDVVRALQPELGRLEVISINPMFAPAMGWAGGTVAVIDVFPGPKSAFCKQLLTNWGSRLEAVSADEHDRLTATIQVATHAAVLCFGSALLSLQFDIEQALRLATPPHRLLLTLLQRMTTQSAEVYWDIQAYHPHAAAVRKELRNALEHIDDDTKSDDARRFEALFPQLQALFETKNELFTEWSRRAFATPD